MSDIFLSLVNQVLSFIYMFNNHDAPGNTVHAVPVEFDREVALLKLKAMGLTIDRLSAEQNYYLSSWQEATDPAPEAS